MPIDQGAILVADVGALLTHVTLLDQVAGEYRLVARAETLSTLELPQADALYGIVQAIAQIEEIIGRQLMHNDILIKPQRPDGTGVDAFLVISSAAGSLPLVIAAVGKTSSGASLHRVARSTYTTLLSSLMLDETEHLQSGEDDNWIDQQVAGLAALPAATVLLAGGIDGGTRVPLERLARIMGLTVLRQDHVGGRDFAHVIFAGNAAARDQISDALANIAPISYTDNVLPRLGEEHLSAARNELIRLYNDRVLSKLPGNQRMRILTNVPLRATAEGYDPIARFISQQHQRQVLLVDVGAMTTSCYAADGKRFSPSMATNCGTAYGALGLLDRVGAEALLRWLPFEMHEQALREYVLNRLLRPQILPMTREDVFIDQALAREALQQAMVGLHDERPDLTYDLIIAGGGVLTHVTHPAEALLMLLDVLQPDSTNTLLVTDVYVDWEGLLPVCGALASYNPDAAICLLEKDALRNGPLASCIVPSGAGKTGELAVEAELTPVGGGKTVSIQVMHGEIRRLALPPGRRGTLRLRPARGVRIGANEPGAEVESDPAAIHGSTLGIVIDARGRPLQLGEESATRRQRILTWLAQLGAAAADNPYRQVLEHGTASAPDQASPEASGTTSPAPVVAEREEAQLGEPMPSPAELGVEVLPDWLYDPGPPEPVDGVVDMGERVPASDPQDFSQLRAELEQQPKKRGWFGRKK